MSLGLPLEFFLHELAVVAIYAALTIGGARLWTRGAWAKVSAVAGAVAVLLHGWYLLAWFARANGVDYLQDQLIIAQGVFLWRWLDVAVIAAVANAVVLGRNSGEQPG